MSFAYTQVLLSSGAGPFNLMGDVDAAETYLAASLNATAWNGQDPGSDGHIQALLTAERWFNSLMWLGVQVDVESWPRSGIDGVDPGAIPAQVSYALYETAGALADDPTLFSSNGGFGSLQDPLFKETKAGPVDATVFRPFDIQWLAPLPKGALGYVQQWLNMGNNAGGPTAKGFRSRNRTDRDFGFEHGI